jgi:hypothetical protein
VNLTNKIAKSIAILWFFGPHQKVFGPLALAGTSKLLAG